MSEIEGLSAEAAHRLPVSAKGVVIRDGSVALVKNDRDEWELPGGKVESTEAPETTVVREIREEIGLEVEATAFLDRWIYEIRPDATVLIVTYGCNEVSEREASLSTEHSEMGWFPLREVAGLVMPNGYKRSISTWATMTGHDAAAV